MLWISNGSIGWFHNLVTNKMNPYRPPESPKVDKEDIADNLGIFLAGFIAGLAIAELSFLAWIHYA